MKKLLKGLLALVMACTFAACSDKTTIDMKDFPEKFEDWTTQDVIDYMAAKEVFTEKDYIYIQVRNDEINPVADSMTELGSYMDNEGMMCSMIYYWNVEENELVKSEYEYAKENKEARMVYTAYDESIPMPCTHMIGQFGFYDMSADLEFAEKFEQAIKDLAADTGAELIY